MQRIKIYEKDKTSNNVTSNTGNSSIFIPGFAIGGTEPYNKLVECKNVNEFITAFGSEAPKFVGNTNYYPYLPTVPTERKKEGPCNLTEFKAQKGTDGIYTIPADIWNKALEYAINDLCVLVTEDATTIYMCKSPTVAGEEWDPTKWDKLIANNEIAEIVKDTDYPGKPSTSTDSKHTFYIMTITITTTTSGSIVRAAFNFLQFYEDGGFDEKCIPIPPSDPIDPATIRMFEAGDSDPSWLMAYTLLSIGMPVAYIRMNQNSDPESSTYDVTPRAAYSFIDNYFKTVDETADILDKGTYNIQFVTTGGYPVLEHSLNIAKNILNVITPTTSSASSWTGRGDCIALLDHTNNPYRSLVGANSVFESLTINESRYLAIFTPWCNVNFSNLTTVPASFVYLYTMASKLNTGNTWSIYAGVGNGRCSIVQSLNVSNAILTNRIAEYYQNDFGPSASAHCSINAITLIRGYGYCIWGNRTFEKYSSADASGFATAFVNIRNLVSEVKKKAYFTSQQLMFEINNDVLWTKFRSNMSVLLDAIKSGNGIDDYQFIKNASDDKTKLSVSIILYPTYGVESIEIAISLEDNNTTTVNEV